MDKLLLLTLLLAFAAALLYLGYRGLQLYRLLTQATHDPASTSGSPQAKQVTIISLMVTREVVAPPAMSGESASLPQP